MKDFVNYQIEELLKHDNKYHYEEKNIDMEFVHYCKKYINHHKKLSESLYNHLNNLFWKYKEE